MWSWSAWLSCQVRCVQSFRSRRAPVRSFCVAFCRKHFPLVLCLRVCTGQSLSTHAVSAAG